jgi:acetyltransferase-like isoleucine patch superfamily enzyme
MRAGNDRARRGTSVGEATVINAMQSIVIGRGVLIAPGCHITDANHGIEGTEPIIRQPRTASPVVIGDHAWLAAGVKVLSGVHVGEGAVLAAGAVVETDVPAYAIVGGVPARVIGSRLQRAPDTP